MVRMHRWGEFRTSNSKGKLPQTILFSRLTVTKLMFSLTLSRVGSHVYY